MNPSLLPNVFSYELFYQLSFLVGFIFLIHFGLKHKYPFSTWIVLIAFTRISFVIGTKISGTDLGSWDSFFTTLRFPESHNKTLYTGIIVGLLALLLAKKFLRFRKPISDAYALILPLGLAIQRLGCLIYGCCFGTASYIFGICYGENTPAFHHHLAQSIIPASASETVLIHPVQLYYIIGSLVSFILVLRYLKSWKSSGSSMWFSLALIGFTRFVADFFRDPATYTTMGIEWYGLKLIQWACLGFMLICLSILWFREYYYKVEPPESENERIALARPAALLLVTLILLFFSRGWYNFSESFAINIVLLVGAVHLAFNFFRHYFHSHLGLRQAIVLTSIFLLLSLSILAQDQSDDTPRVSRGVGMGFASGSIYEPTICGPDYRTNLHGVNVEYSYSKMLREDRNRKLTTKFQLARRNTFESQFPDIGSESFHGNAGIWYDESYKYFGFGVGGAYGNYSNVFFSTDGRTGIPLPYLSLRFGRMRTYYFDISVLHPDLYVFGNPFISAGFTFTNFKNPNFRYLKTGLSDVGPFVFVKYDLNRNLGLNLHLHAGNKYMFDNGLKDYTIFGGVGIFYNFYGDEGLGIRE